LVVSNEECILKWFTISQILRLTGFFIFIFIYERNMTYTSNKW